MFNLIIPGQSVRIRDGCLTIPQSKTYSSVLNSHKIRIKVPPQLLDKKIREVKIIPLYKGRAFKIAYGYEIKCKLKSSDDSLEAATAPPAGIAPVKQRRFSSRLIEQITLKRNNSVNDFIKKTARHIANHCIANHIGTIVVGHNSDFNRGINLGKVVNQQFTQIPFGALRRQLKTLCERHGMNFVEQEESYTSKASFLDLDSPLRIRVA